MAHLRVGINENVVLKSVELVEKEGKYTLDFSFTDGSISEDATLTDSPFQEVLDEDGYVITSGSGVSKIRVWQLGAPNPVNFDGTQKTPTQILDEAKREIGEFQNLLRQFCLCYMTSDKIKFDPYKNTGLTVENMRVLLPTNEKMGLMFRNLSQEFINLITPEITNDVTKLRLLLVRQSVTKHFASFRKKFIREQPIVEPMIIEREASKLKFSDYEISKGLNDGTPIKAEANPEDSNEPPLDETAVFGQ